MAGSQGGRSLPYDYNLEAESTAWAADHFGVYIHVFNDPPYGMVPLIVGGSPNSINVLKIIPTGSSRGSSSGTHSLSSWKDAYNMMLMCTIPLFYCILDMFNLCTIVICQPSYLKQNLI